MLSDESRETWGNTILYRLAETLGYPKTPDGEFQVDPDELVNEVCKTLEVHYTTCQ